MSITTGSNPFPAPYAHSPRAAASASFSRNTPTPNRSRRQLKNEVERAVALAQPGDGIDLGDLSELVRNAVAPAGPALDAIDDRRGPPRQVDAAPLRDARLAFESQYISDVLDREGGNVSRAATVLGISRVMLHKKLKQLGLR